MAIRPTFNIADSVMVDAVIQGPDECVFLAHSESSLDADSPPCQLIGYAGGHWNPLCAWSWQGVALANIGDRSAASWLVLGRDGEVGYFTNGATTESRIDPNVDTLGPFRGLKRLGHGTYAFGMKREVFELTAGLRWTRRMEGFDPVVPGLSPEEERKLRRKRLGGVNGLALDAGGTLTAVGMRGEIWIREGNQWQPCESPTNLMLKDVCLGADGLLHCCGLAGTLLQGAGSSWRTVDYQGVADLDFCAVAWFDGALYLADGHSVRRLVAGTLELVDFGTQEIVPGTRLVASESTILSIAGQEVWQSSDGRVWRCILG